MKRVRAKGLSGLLLALTLSLPPLGASATESAPQHAEPNLIPNVEEKAAFILFEVTASGDKRRSIRGLTLKYQHSGAEIELPMTTGLQLMQVDAGVLAPTSFNLVGTKGRKIGISNAHPTKGIVVKPASVTYIGSWNLRYNSKILVDGLEQVVVNTGYSVTFDVPAIQDYALMGNLPEGSQLGIAHINGKQLAIKIDNATSSLVASANR